MPLDKVCLLSDRRWDGHQLPGLTPHAVVAVPNVQTPAGGQYVAVEPTGFRVEERALLCSGGARLVAIGQGFRDEHINRMIIRAARDFGLHMLVVDPAGADIAWRVNPRPSAWASISAESDLAVALEQAVQGASRRRLREIFGGDRVEHAKLMRFLA